MNQPTTSTNRKKETTTMNGADHQIIVIADPIGGGLR